MKYSRTTLAGLGLALVAILLAVVVSLRPARNDAAAPDLSADEAAKAAVAARDAENLRARRARAAEAAAPPAAARELELLWARGRAPELLAALERLSTDADAERWQVVGPILIEQAATEGRPDVAAYLLATADAAPASIRREIHAAALDNRDEGVRDAARLELQNITGQVFKSGAEAREWFASHPVAPPEVDDIDEAVDQ